mgnify:CR=1 FL=1
MQNIEYKKFLNNPNFSKLIVTNKINITEFDSHNYENLEIKDCETSLSIIYLASFRIQYFETGLKCYILKPVSQIKILTPVPK